MMTTEEKFKEIIDRMYRLFEKKNTDYGDHFCQYTKQGAYMDLLRKWGRIEVIFKNGEIKCEDETLEDTLIDLANYCVLTVILLEKEKS